LDAKSSEAFVADGSIFALLGNPLLFVREGQTAIMFISAGFFVTRSVSRPDYVDQFLLPDPLVSMSSCFAKFLPNTWCIEWTYDSDTDRQGGAEFFDLTEDQLLELIATVTPAFGHTFGWPNVIWELGFARSLATTFLRSPETRILELGLHEEFVPMFCRDAEPRQQEGFAPVGRQGIHEAILNRRPTSELGVPLGFEPLLSDGQLSCSWLCNGLETLVAQRLHVRPNRAGLIETLEEARAVVSFIGRDDVGAEPGLWLPWLIIDHTTGAAERLSSHPVG
jgi:hypothetical protein